jgi:hypothetical protein
MSRRSTPVATAKKGAAAILERDILDLPVNIISDRLNRAHATLDLVYTAISLDRDQGEMFIEQLDVDTLDYALNTAMSMIKEAKDANESR